MFAGCSGSMAMPRKIAGSEMSRMEEFSVAMSTPRVVFDSATQRYRGESGWRRPRCRPAPAVWPAAIVLLLVMSGCVLRRRRPSC